MKQIQFLKARVQQRKQSKPERETQKGLSCLALSNKKASLNTCYTSREVVPANNTVGEVVYMLAQTLVGLIDTTTSCCPIQTIVYWNDLSHS